MRDPVGKPQFNNPPWTPLTDPVQLANIGKLGEETAELSKIIARIIIQGMNGIDPATGEINWIALQKEMADVTAHIENCCEEFRLYIDSNRVELKKALQQTWVEHLLK